MPKVGTIELPFDSNLIKFSYPNGKELVWKLDFLPDKYREGGKNLAVNALIEGRFRYIGIVATRGDRIGTLIETGGSYKEPFWNENGHTSCHVLVHKLVNGKTEGLTISEHNPSWMSREAMSKLSDQQLVALRDLVLAEIENRDELSDRLREQKADEEPKARKSQKKAAEE